MDDAAAIRANDAENCDRSEDRISENNDHPSTEDSGDGVGIFCCRDGGAAFKEEAAFSEHRYLQPQQHTCLHSSSDASPSKEKDNEAPYLCTLCLLSFNERIELHLHMKNHDPISPNNPGPTKQQTYECPECGKSYAVIGHFLNHLRSHKQPSKSLFHDLEHLKKKSFQCEFCGRNYSRVSALDAHRRCHEGKLVKSKNKSPGDAVQTGESAVETKPSESLTGDDSEKCFKCMCGKSFSTASRLKTHQRFSRNSLCSPGEMKPKPKKNCSEFYCSECNKGFTSHIALFNHQRWHMNNSHDSAERFPCEECGKVFTTLTFYYKHQRTAHSNETPAKSFLHQVCQVQKKAFECKDCGLKFSRASALNSHQLQHTDAFRQTEKGDQTSAVLLHLDKTPESGFTEAELSEDSPKGKVQSESFPPTHVEEEVHMNEIDEGVDCYEPGDFNVQVISASESEDEVTQDMNPDLELLCESDQDVRDDTEVVKPEMDLKIVQIDFEQTDEQSELLENEAAGERLDCPECFRWFTNPTSLRVHRMWHGVRKRRQQAQGQSVAVYACETDSNEAQFNHSDQTPSNNLLNQAEKNTFTCNECGDAFPHLSALVSHQLHHPQRKLFQCPDCMMSYLHAANLFNHMKTCSAQKTENLSVSKKEYNPKKTLLGPKIFHCEQCGKGFWSLGAYSHHKQNQTECVDLRLRKGLLGSLNSANGRSRSGIKVACPVCGRKFRHKGIMALHKRKHENGNHKCELCNRSFRLFSSLLRHQVVHSSQLLPPPVKSFQHQLEQLKKNTYSCPDCGKLFSRAKALQFHMKSHGYESGSSPSSLQAAGKSKDLQCPTCLGHFNNKVSLKAHQKLCTKRDDEIIVKTEPSEGDVKMHKETKTQELLDLIREKTDVKKKDAQKIVKDRNGDELKKQDEASQKYKCNKCDRSFPVVGALNFHKRIHVEDKSVTKSHTGLSLFKKPTVEDPGKGLIHCSDCGRRFMTKSALGSHRRWHKEKKSSQEEEDFKSPSLGTEDGPFQCEKCQKYFFNHRVLHRHRIFNPLCQSKTEFDSNRSAGINHAPQRFSCPLCGEMFEQVLLLASHFKHCKNLKAFECHGEPRRIPGHGDVNYMRNQGLSSNMKPKAHQCSVCSMTFAKARGLRAHKWQAHSKSKKHKNRLPVSMKTEPSDSSSIVDESEPQQLTLNSGPDCGKQPSSAVSLLEHKRVCLEVKQESKPETQTPEPAAEIPPPPSRLSEHAVKCLFKCDKCGKAFQTEEQMGNHKNKAKSRPHCCALCCHGFWTENQLQQHLAWHDEVRCRLPNEVRFRLSAAMTSKPFKPDCPVTLFGVNPPALHPSSQTQSEH